MAYATGRVKLRRSRKPGKWIPFGWVSIHNDDQVIDKPIHAPKGIEFDTREKAEVYSERMLQEKIKTLRREGVVE